MKERVLITGGFGMLGQHIKEEVEQNVDFNNNNVSYFFASRADGDLRDINQTQFLFEKIKPTAVIHLASGVGGLYGNMEHNYEFLVHNTLIHLNVVECCRTYNVKKLINILSTCVFPENAPQPLAHNFLHYGPPHKSNRGYAYSKRFLELASEELHKLTGTQVVNLIPTNLYGKYENFEKEGNHVIPELIRKFMNGDMIIKGSGYARRQFLYAGDFAKIILLFLFNDVAEKYLSLIVSPPEEDEVTIQHVAELLRNKLQLSGNIIYDSSFSDGMLKKTVSDYELREFLPTFTFTSLETGLGRVIDYYKNTVAHLKRKRLV